MTWPAARTLYCASSIVPLPFASTSMTNVDRSTPMIVFPYSTFSPKAPYAAARESAVESARQRAGD